MNDHYILVIEKLPKKNENKVSNQNKTAHISAKP